MKKERYGYCTTDAAGYNILLQSAKEMRRYPTMAESVLWSRLSGGRLGARFRRQHPVMGYIPDFVCLAHKLIIEVDGGYHNKDVQQQLDAERTQILSSAGYKVLRFTNEEVIADTGRVVSDIAAALSK